MVNKIGEKHPHAAQLFENSKNSKDINKKKTAKVPEADKNLESKDVKEDTSPDFNKMTKPQLIEFAESNQIKIVKSAKKADIILKIQENV